MPPNSLQKLIQEIAMIIWQIQELKDFNDKEQKIKSSKTKKVTYVKSNIWRGEKYMGV